MRLIIIIASLLLTGCSVLSPVKTKEINRYVIDTTPSAHHFKHQKHRVILLVSPTDASPAYQTTQMAYTTKPHELAYYGENQWAETPAQMLQPLIIKTLEETRNFKAVVTVPFSGKFDYLLDTQLISLNQDYTTTRPKVTLHFRAALLRASTHQVIASHEWSIQETMEDKGPYAGVLASNLVSKKLLSSIRQFVVKHAK